MYNVIVTAYRGESNYLLKQLNEHGDFKKTAYRDVLVGTVENIREFLSKVSEEPPLSLARVMPVNEVFEFSDLEELFKALKKRVKEIKVKGSFKVTVERRGHKGELDSQQWARELGSLIKGGVDLMNPEEEIVISIMKDSCGLSILPKSMKEEFFYVRAK